MGRWILLTGGAGYIGSHTALEFLKEGHSVVIVDDFSTSTVHNYKKLAELYPASVFLEQGTLSEDLLDGIFAKYPIFCVIHFAGYKSVGESVRNPIKYYENNIGCTIALLKSMRIYNVRNLIFSSSASVYGVPEYLPIDEKHPCNPKSPYGKTKLFIEELLKDVTQSNPKFRCVVLRYFNPVGTDVSGILKENPKNTPENLMPYIIGVIKSNYPHLSVFGNDYDTKDGTCIRDFIHVTDLATGHLAALKLFDSEKSQNFHVYNLGTSHPHSVLDIIKAMQRVSDKEIPLAIAPRREGDVPVCYADASLAYEELGWKAVYDIDIMCKTSL